MLSVAGGDVRADGGEQYHDTHYDREGDHCGGAQHEVPRAEEYSCGDGRDEDETEEELGGAYSNRRLAQWRFGR